MKQVFIIIALLVVVFGCSEKKKSFLDNDKIALELNFNDGSIRFYEKVYFKSFGSCDDKLDCTEIKIEYPEIISDSPSTDSINNFITKHILNLPFNEDEYSSFDEISDSLFSSYISVQQEFEDYHNGWFIHSNTKINGAYKDILSVESEEIIYTGGANEYYNLTFANFNINNGNEVELEDIINKDKIKELESIGKECFFKVKNIPPNTTLEDAGFWFENKKFSLNDNFAITDSGLVFFYNLYEIAPRSSGTSKLFISKEKLKSITNIY